MNGRDSVRESGFPEFPWDRDGLIASANHDGLALLERWALGWHGAPRCDSDLAKRYCRDVLPPGRVLLYGAGSHSAWLLDVLKDVPFLEPIGILDRMADSFTSFHGLPVWKPEDGQGMGDYVLVAHTSLEQEMLRALTEVGCPADRIRAFYSSSAYAALAKERVVELADQIDGEPVENLVINCSHSAIVSDRTLTGLLGRGRTLNVFIGRASGLEGNWLFETIDLQESLAALKRLLERVRPRSIYVRTVVYKNYLMPLVKLWSRHSVVVGEPYDMNILWNDRDLELLFGLNAETIRMLRLGELLSGRELDLLVSKRGGPTWERVSAAWRTPCLMYFPALQEPPSEPLAPGSLGDIAYAGFLPAAAFLKEFKSGYNFIPLLTAICEEGGLNGTIFNGAHIPGEGDGLFADYLKAFTGPLRYHSRLPYDKMLQVLTGFRYGWLCDHRDRFQGDRYVGVCNRWTGYVSAGLPVLIDEDWDFMVDLTRRFGAGLVVTDMSSNAVLSQIANADWPALHNGTRNLWHHLDACNGAIQQQIAAHLDASRRQPEQEQLTCGSSA